MLEIKKELIGSGDPKAAESFLTPDDFEGGTPYTSTSEAYRARVEQKELAELALQHGEGRHIVCDVMEDYTTREGAGRRLVPKRGHVTIIPANLWGDAIQRKKEEVRMRRARQVTFAQIQAGEFQDTQDTQDTQDKEAA